MDAKSSVAASSKSHTMGRTRTTAMLVSVAAAYFIWAVLCSILPPIYPAEAEKRGIKPTEYGFVFGITHLMAFLSAPIFGRYGHHLGAKRLYNTGAFVQAVCGLLFGLLNCIESSSVFLYLSFLLRGISGVADVAAWGAVMGILMKLFPGKNAQILAFTDVFFGMGYMIGPAVGSFLYELGGFSTPFLVSGAFALCVAVSLVFLIPDVKSERKNVSKKELVTEKKRPNNKLTYASFFKYPRLVYPFIDNTVCFFNNGLIGVLMERHLVD